MKILKKKGFTIVELVIVIAVIAILAAVLIPTFSSLIEKANNSAAESELRQIKMLIEIELASGAWEFVIIGESGESIPVTIIRNSDGTLSVKSSANVNLADSLNSCPALDSYGSFAVSGSNLIYTTKNGGMAIWVGIVGTVINEPPASEDPSEPPTPTEPVIKYSEGLEFVLYEDSNGITSYYVAGIGECTDTEIFIPPTHEGKDVTKIVHNAFSDNTDMTSIYIPESVNTIEHGPFSGCTSLESITVAEGNEIYQSVDNCLIATRTKTLIAGCKNSDIPDDGSVTKIGQSAFSGCSGLESIEIPDGVTEIGRAAFIDCSSLNEIELPDSLLNIQTHAFYNSGLTSIRIPAAVNEIAPNAFDSCDQLVYFSVDSENTKYKAKDGKYLIQDQTLIRAFTNDRDVSINESIGITAIGPWAFTNCSALKSIKLPEGVVSIGKNAFANCNFLEYVTIPKTVIKIDTSIFDSSPSVSFVEIHFAGSEDDWDKIEKADGWNGGFREDEYTVTFTVTSDPTP